MDKRNEKLNELDEIEKTAGNLLKELNNLEDLQDFSTPQTNYLELIKTMQNEMKETILRGIESNDRDTFLKGLEFYEKNFTILSNIGDKQVCEDYQHEMIQILTDLVVHFKIEINDPLRRYFIIISLQYVAKIYEDAKNFDRAIEIRLTISNLLNSWAAALEYSSIFLDYLLGDEISKASEFLRRFDKLESKIYLKSSDVIEQSVQSKRIITLKEFCENVLSGVTKDLPVFFGDAKELLDDLKITDNFAFNQVLYLFDLYLKKYESKALLEKEIPIEPHSPITSESQLLSNIKNVVLESIGSQAIPANKASKRVSFDTSTLVTELKQFISSSIKTLSQEIVSNLSKYTMAAPRTQVRGSSHRFDENTPEIKIVGSVDPDEKPKRPKLSDVLDSIVVSE